MADSHLLDLLHRGAAAWNDWRTEHSNPTAAQQLDFTKLDLRDLDLPNFDFRGYRLEHVDFTGSKLPSANFTGVLVGLSLLDDVDLTGATLDGVILSRSKLRRAILRRVRCAELTDATLSWEGGYGTGSHMSTADFSGADLTGAVIKRAGMFGNNFTEANLTDAVFESCDMNSSTFARTNLTNTVLDAELRECKFPDALLHNTCLSKRLYRVNFQGADLSQLRSDTSFSGVQFYDADFSGSNLGGCTFDGSRLTGIFVGATLRGASFKEAQITKQAYGIEKAHWAGADFTGAQFEEGLNLAGLAFQDVKLTGARLPKVILSGADFTGVDLTDCQFPGAQLDGAALRGVRGMGVNFTRANLSEADLSDSDFSESQLRDANLSGAKFHRTKLEYAMLVRATVEGAEFVQVNIFGLSNWDMRGVPARQQGLVITQPGENTITVSDIQLAQLLYTLLRRQNFTPLIDQLTSKAVLLLGRFTPERKAILDAPATELSQRDLLPIIFDFTEPASRNVAETVRLLAGLSRFVIADLTDPKSTPYELHLIAPDLRVPILTLIENGQAPYSMLEALRDGRPWVNYPLVYDSEAAAIATVDELVKLADQQLAYLQAQREANHQEYDASRRRSGS